MKKTLIIQKFGGTSLSTLTRIKRVAKKIATSLQNSNVVVVVSAMGGSTNDTILKCNAFGTVSNNLQMQAYDVALSSCETLSAAMLAMALNQQQKKAITLQGWQVAIKTTEDYNNAKIIAVDTNKLISLLQQGIVPIVTGFQGITNNNIVTTLGRGGSDTTAVAIAAALQANVCEIYTDVQGVFSADPRLVKSAQHIDVITHEMMLDIAQSGAKVLDSKSIKISEKYKVPLRILHSHKNAEQWTNIIETKTKNKRMENPEALCVILKNDIVSYSVHLDNFDVVTKLFVKLKSIALTNLEIDAQCFICKFDAPITSKTQIDRSIKTFAKKYESISDFAQITIIGWYLDNHTFCNKVIVILKNLQITPQKFTIETRKIRITVPLAKANSVTKKLHQELIEKGNKKIDT
ncbi:aspartate kinase [Candidatus Sneabacter namystus]|uniref:Aspartokinase n=1 Tax=Candidatus Sneabacter namystus TaxID=2601646 RepID=A0A5C0UIH3_9RICK|nr:aspartate kinase [Candidatus Sneabacter namystus]QEK39589.1 aspartate kinase [Candidatus Sneabacter namystus]